MVSLNEKRSKVRYIVQNKSEWNKDESQYGKKILEKMGWTSSAGLGKNEDGMTEHVNVQLKSNSKGLGYVKSKFDSTWIGHSLSFDSLLDQLNKSHSSSSNVEGRTSNLSNFNANLQTTKTRFNYVKQSAAKDLSRRTTDDFHSIFGSSNGKPEEVQPIEQEDDSKEKQEEDQRYVTSHLSIDEYFRMKRKRSPPTQEPEEQDEGVYRQSNLSTISGYQGWPISSDIDHLLKVKEKSRKRKGQVVRPAS